MKHENENMGGLNEKIMLNHCESLNHRFIVARNVGKEYCEIKRKELEL